MQISRIKTLFTISFVALGSLSLTPTPIAVDRITAALIPVKPELERKPLKFKNWGLFNSGNSHISAPDAWKLETGSRKVIVAVIDTGLDIHHGDLKNNIWKKKTRKIATPLKPVKRGKTEIFGWDFTRNKPNPRDEHGHGTHVAGIIGAVSNPSKGISGVAHEVAIMAVKYYKPSASGPVNLRNTVRAINYAVDNGAKVINYSGGGPQFSEEEYLAIKKAEKRGVLFVSAAGNERQNTDLVQNFYYPAAYGLSNIISVAAIKINNELLESSNWGRKKVDVAAPGENIWSTLPRDQKGKERYGYMSGTSQATAFVSGLAALMLSQDPSLKPHEIKKIILSSVDKVSPLKNRVASGGKINAHRALMAVASRRKPKFTSPGLLAQDPRSILEIVPKTRVFQPASAK